MLVATSLLTACTSLPQKELSDAELNCWNGTYKNDRVVIQLYRTAYAQAGIVIEQIGIRTELPGIYFRIGSTEKLSYRGKTLFHGKVSITIHKTEEGIQIKASSGNAESIFNEINGDYVKESFSALGWDGVYEREGNYIVLAEIHEGIMQMRTYFTLSSNGFPHIYNGDGPVMDYSETEISYNNLKFGDATSEANSMSIIKMTDGIQVEILSTNSDSAVDTLSGNYIKLD